MFYPNLFCQGGTSGLINIHIFWRPKKLFWSHQLINIGKILNPLEKRLGKWKDGFEHQL